MSDKIRLDHLQRRAYIYIRQSTLHQVHHNEESLRRQYALKERAVALGWSSGSVEVVDEDLGLSGKDEGRFGFQRLMEAISRGEAGAVFCLEASRLSRLSSAWHALIETCAWQDTLLIDEERVYDPNCPDDRLLLDIHGLVQANELEVLRRRMQVSREEKARRGELRVRPPTGVVQNRGEELRLDPDEEVQGAIRLLFEQFQRLGSAAAVTRYFHEHAQRFPTRHFGGTRDGELEWKPLTYKRTLVVLHNPAYAGAYAYGRRAWSRRRKPREKWKQREVRMPREEWTVLIWDILPGYISREEYEENQRRLAANRPERGRSGAVRSGAALLSGRVLCGLCGRPLYATYSGTDGQYVTYICCAEHERGRGNACQRVPGNGVDQSVAQAVLEALTPAEVALSLSVLDNVAQQAESLRRQWERRLERARYETDLAQRRYRQVEPENRLVARVLEGEWEERLKALAQTEQERETAQRESPLILSEAEREELLAMTRDLPALWEAESTTVEDRKEVLRLLVGDVTLTRRDEDILVQLRWATNEAEEWTAPLPQRGVRTDPAVLERIRELATAHTDAEIATCLNKAGMHTARGLVFNAFRISGLRRIHRIVKVRRA
jgi:DNA invertase Pin-like site-specific DNA recombinase